MSALADCLNINIESLFSLELNKKEKSYYEKRSKDYNPKESLTAKQMAFLEIIRASDEVLGE